MCFKYIKLNFCICYKPISKTERLYNSSIHICISGCSTVTFEQVPGPRAGMGTGCGPVQISNLSGRAVSALLFNLPWSAWAFMSSKHINPIVVCSINLNSNLVVSAFDMYDFYEVWVYSNNSSLMHNFRRVKSTADKKAHFIKRIELELTQIIIFIFSF